MGALDPQDPVWRPESWFLHAARRAHQLNARRVDALDRRLARDDTCTSPFVEFADSAPRGSASESLVDALLEGRLEAPEPNAPPSPRPREAGLYHAARTNDEVGVVPTVAPARWNARWPKTRVPGRRFVAVFDDEPAAAAVFDGASAEREPPPVADQASARERERVAAIARAFRGLERAGETPVKRVSPFAADAADASSSEPLKERSLKERAVAEPAELSAIRALDRAAYFFSSDQCLSPYDAKGETADEAFARLSLRGARERRDEPTAEAFRTARDGAKRTTLFRLTRVKLAMARAEEEAKSAQTASERVVAAQVVY